MSVIPICHDDVEYIYDDDIDQYLIMQEQDHLPDEMDYLRQHIDWEGVARDEKTNWTVVTLDVHSEACQADPTADHDDECYVGDYWTTGL